MNAILTPYLKFMRQTKAAMTFYQSALGGKLKMQTFAESGTIDMPLKKQFWSDIYGQLTDKFGVHWMVNISKASQV